MKKNMYFYYFIIAVSIKIKQIECNGISNINYSTYDNRNCTKIYI